MRLKVSLLLLMFSISTLVLGQDTKREVWDGNNKVTIQPLGLVTIDNITFQTYSDLKGSVLIVVKDITNCKEYPIRIGVPISGLFHEERQVRMNKMGIKLTLKLDSYGKPYCYYLE